MSVMRVVWLRALLDAEPVFHKRGVCWALNVADVLARLAVGRLGAAPVVALVGSVHVVRVSFWALGVALVCVAVPVIGVLFRTGREAHAVIWDRERESWRTVVDTLAGAGESVPSGARVRLLGFWPSELSRTVILHI